MIIIIHILHLFGSHAMIISNSEYGQYHCLFHVLLKENWRALNFVNSTTTVMSYKHIITKTRNPNANDIHKFSNSLRQFNECVLCSFNVGR